MVHDDSQRIQNFTYVFYIPKTERNSTNMFYISIFKILSDTLYRIM